MFKILLINPPRKYLVHLETSASVDLGEISSFPPIGLMYLGEALRQANPAFEVRILDAQAEKLSYRQMIARVVKYRPHLVGITAFTYTFYDVWQTACRIKKIMPQVPIVVGGPHLYIFVSQTMKHKCFDYAVAGDGEEVFAHLCQSLYEGKKVIPRQGLYWREGNNTKGKGVAFLKNLDSIVTPAVDLIDPFAYFSTIGKGRATGTICTSRGCPFQCTFCQVPHRSYRMRSVGNVIAEIALYLEKNITDFFFFDDLFNITKDRVIEFCQEILRRKIKISWMFRGRVDQMNDKMLKLCKKAGCHTISVGIEDSTDEGLKKIKKNISIRQACDAVRLMKKNRIRSSTNWIIGFPHHKSLKDLEHLLQTAIKIDSDYAQFSILQCLPGSELYTQAVAEGGIDPRAWLNYVLAPVRDFSPPIWEKHLTKRDLYLFYEKAYKSYYFRPKILWREATRIRSVPEAFTKFNNLKTIFFKNP